MRSEDSKRRPSAMRSRSVTVGSLLAAALSIVPGGHGARADTTTVGVFVTFAERIEVRQAPREVPVRGKTDIAGADAVAEPGTAAAAFAVHATSGRAVMLSVEAPESMALVCSYGGTQWPCSADGIAAVSLADASLTISLDPANTLGDAATASDAAAIDVTIAYQ